MVDLKVSPKGEGFNPSIQTIKRELVERYYNGESILAICEETGVPRSTLYSWVNKHAKLKSSNKAEITYQDYHALKRRYAKLEERLAVLHATGCGLSASLKEKLATLEKLYEQGHFSVRALCEALEVPRGTFYNHVLRNKRQNSSYFLKREHLKEEIMKAYQEGNQIYGANKITALLREQGVITSSKMVSELMKEMNISSIRTGAKAYYKKHIYESKKDELNLNFTSNAPNKVWVSDVTTFKFMDRYYHICIIMDLYSRKVVSYKISGNNSTQLVTSAFRGAYQDRTPDHDLIFHTDRGKPYTSRTFERLLLSSNVKHSYSPAGKPTHNAVIEAFNNSIKQEALHRTKFRSGKEVLVGVKEYIEFYNQKRPHGTLNYKTPDAFEKEFYEKKGSGNK